MEPILTSISTNHSALTFTLSGTNVSIANGIRRTILSDIPTLVFRTTPYERNKCVITANTSRFTNEMVKQRLSCIPICVSDIESFPMKTHIMELRVENTSDTDITVTTHDFKIKNTETGEYLSNTKVQEIFPPDPFTGDYIEFIHLKAQLSPELPGGIIDLTCEFDLGTSKENGSFSVVSKCSYGNAVDTAEQQTQLAIKTEEWKKADKDVVFETADWKLLDAFRCFLPNSFKFTIESIGVFSNMQLVEMACSVLIDRLTRIGNDPTATEIDVANSTLSNGFDIVLHGEDYTIGKIIEYFMFSLFYETGMMTYIGFMKKHPHDEYSIIRVAFADKVDKGGVSKSEVVGCLSQSVARAVQYFHALLALLAKQKK